MPELHARLGNAGATAVIIAVTAVVLVVVVAAAFCIAERLSMPRRRK